MKWICVLMVLWQGVLSVMEVRSYQIGKEIFANQYHLSCDVNPYDIQGAAPAPLGSVLTKSPFESRFLTEGELVWDCSHELGELLGIATWTGLAVIDEVGAQLVVKAEARDHMLIAEFFKRMLQVVVETKVTLYRVPRVTMGRDLRSTEEIEKGQLLAGLTCVHIAGCAFEARSGDFVIKGEAQVDYDFEFFESRISWTSGIKGNEFQLETGLVVNRDEPLIVELGSKDGVSSLVAIMKQNLVLFNGVKLDEWILKEEGGAFLKEERMRDEEEFMNLPEIDGVRSIRVPSNILSLYSFPAEDYENDPFAPEGDPIDEAGLLYEGNTAELESFPKGSLYDIKGLLRTSGVSFEEDDFVMFFKQFSTLLVKTSRENEALIEGLWGPHDYDFPRLIRLDFVRLESEEEVTSKMENIEVKEKVGATVLPGSSGSFQLGESLFGEVEAAIDANDELVETRVTLASKADLSEAFYKSGVVLKSGTPVVIQQSRVGNKWEAWVVTAEVLEVGGEAK